LHILLIHRVRSLLSIHALSLVNQDNDFAW